ncbi:MAG: DUF616 domain-containing protein [Candidatus Magnetomorum sp.]|nr:DUF616 domain-containing protein [Candidatus Magnetomorum sp.]
MKKNIVIYTAISGDYDNLKSPEYVHKDYDYVCFSDNQFLKSDVWHIVPFEEHFEDMTLTTRQVKLLPHRYFSSYEFSLWIDGSIVLKNDISHLLNNYLQNENIAMFKHPLHRCSIKDEVAACIELKKDLQRKLIFQRDLYYSLGYNDTVTCIPLTCCIFRRHNEKKLIMAMEEWWTHVRTYSKRDQVSFPFVAWKLGLPFNLINDQLFNDYFSRSTHDGQNFKDRIISYLSQGGLFQVNTDHGQFHLVHLSEKNL